MEINTHDESVLMGMKSEHTIDIMVEHMTELTKHLTECMDGYTSCLDRLRKLPMTTRHDTTRTYEFSEVVDVVARATWVLMYGNMYKSVLENHGKWSTSMLIAKLYELYHQLDGEMSTFRIRDNERRPLCNAYKTIHRFEALQFIKTSVKQNIVIAEKLEISDMDNHIIEQARHNGQEQ